MPRNLTPEEIQKNKLTAVRDVCDAEFAWIEPDQIEAAEGEAKLKKFSITAYTGGPVRVGFGYAVVVDLAGMTIAGESLPILKDHDPTQIVGHTDSADKSLKRLKLTGVVSGVGDAAAEVVALGANGFPWQASIGASIEEMQFLAKGESANVNGRSISGPVYIARKSTLRETSFVAIGADAGTSGRIAANLKERNVTMDTDLKAYIEGKGFDPATLNETQIAGMKASFEKEKAPPLPPPPPKKEPTQPVSELLAAMQAEADRKEEIGRLFVAACEGKTSAQMEELRKVHDGAIEAKFDVVRAQQSFQLANIQMGRGNDVAIHVGTGNKAPTKRVLEAAICQTAGLKDIDSHFSDQELQAAHDRFHREGIGLKELLRIAARANGHSTDNLSLLELQRAAFNLVPQGSGYIAASGTSTFSLPGILGDSAHKFLLEGWGGGEMAWEKVTDVVNVRDFKTITQYKLSGSLKYEKVGIGGELKHGAVSEGSYTVKADTYGKIFAITREHIVNDDMNALSAIPRELGYGANDAFNEVFWTEWLSGDGGFFAYTSSGVMSSAAALATIAAAEAKFFELTKPNGTPLGVVPNVMLVPNGSYRVAASAMASPIVTGGSTTVPVSNTFQSEYEVVRSAFLSNTSYSGYSPVKWYLCVVRPGFAPIQTAFLNGQRAPMIESASADFNTLGIQMRGVHDFGVNLFEARAAVQGSGA